MDSLKKSIDAIKEAGAKKKDALKQETDDKKAAEKSQLDATIERLNNEKQLTKQNYAVLVEFERQHESDIQAGFGRQKIALSDHYKALNGESGQFRNHRAHHF